MNKEFEENLGLLDSASKKSFLTSAQIPSVRDELGSSTFVTGIDAGGSVLKSKIEFSPDDVRLVHRWNAHTDTINWITYTP